MVLFISLLILAHWIMGKDVSHLVARLKQVNWEQIVKGIWSRIMPYALSIGRTAARPLLELYFVLADEETTTFDKVLIYGALAYILIPIDVLPRAIYKFIGVLDDGMAAMYVYRKIKDRVTPKIHLKVESILDEWFGAVYEIR